MLRYVLLAFLFCGSAQAQMSYERGYSAGYNEGATRTDPFTEYGRGVINGRNDADDDDDRELKAFERFEERERKIAERPIYSGPTFQYSGSDDE